MRKLRMLVSRLPRKARICLNILTIALAVFLIYVFAGSPAFTVTTAFRRAEKAQLVGPSEILARLRPEGAEYDHLVLAATEDSVTLFAYDRWDSRLTTLVYREKTGPITVLAAPGSTHFWAESSASVPVFVFDSHPDAVRAELELTLSASYKGEDFEKTYCLTASRESSGYFAFTLEARNAPTLGAEGRAIYILQNVCSNSMADTLEVAIPATVRLYNGQDALIAEEALTIRSAAALARNDD